MPLIVACEEMYYCDVPMMTVDVPVLSRAYDHLAWVLQRRVIATRAAVGCGRHRQTLAVLQYLCNFDEQ